MLGVAAADTSTMYSGRFAPSPTGPLHLGSLVAALGSYLEARSQDGAWLVRMEDLDRPREIPGASDAILSTLDAFGFEWKGPVLYQSTRTDAYRFAVEQLRDSGLVFPCACSRREIAGAGRPGAEGAIYPGTCRTGLPPGRRSRSLRLRTEYGPIQVADCVQGELKQDLARDVGDFVLRRADGIHAYQLAVVVDDGFQGITHVVRGADLILSTPRQVFLQRALALPTPAYSHLPLVLDRTGRKLSKSTSSAPVYPAEPLPALLQAWAFLEQRAFCEHPANLNEFWEQAVEHWDPRRIPCRRTGKIPLPLHPDA